MAHLCFLLQSSGQVIQAIPLKKGELDADMRIGSPSYYVYKKSGSSFKWGEYDSDGKTPVIAAESGNSVVSLLRRKGFEVYEIENTRQGLLMLASNRIDAFVEQDIKVDSLLNYEEFINITKSERPISSNDYCLIFSKQFMSKNKELTTSIWTSIKAVRDDIAEKRISIYQSE